jgi:uncharacterized membrane protein YccC
MSRRRPTALLRARRLRALSRLGFQRLPMRYRLSEGFEHGALAVVAALFAYVPTQLLGLREGFWSAITALAVVQTEIQMARSTARDQFTGAAIGGIAGVGIVVAFGSALPAYALAIFAAILAAWALGLPTAARLAAITATIILLVPHAGTAEHMMMSRVGEVAWGVVVAIAVVWLAQLIRRESGWERETP